MPIFDLVSLSFLAAFSAALPQDAPPSQPLPEAARVEGAAAKDLDPTTVNLNWETVSVADLPLLARFPGLRRLQINADFDAEIGWRSVTAEELAPVCALSGLEDLTLPYCAHLTLDHLRRLSACKRLASVLFINESLNLDQDVAGVLATWPALRSLRLSLITVTPAGLAALVQVPNLELLELSHCRALDAEGVAGICKLPKLRALMLSGLGRPDMLARLKGLGATPSWALTMDAMKAIAAMPALRELTVEECTLIPKLLTVLSPKLTSIKLGGHDVDAQALQDLRQHGSLRGLQLSEVGVTEEQRAQFRKEVVRLLGTLRLERFHWNGRTSDDVRQAIAGQSDLRELTIPCGPDLEFAASLPKLERLELWKRLPPIKDDGATAVDDQPVHPTPAEFGVLRTSKSLRVVAYHDRNVPADVADGLRKALGPKIALHFVE